MSKLILSITIRPERGRYFLQTKALTDLGGINAVSYHDHPRDAADEAARQLDKLKGQFLPPNPAPQTPLQ